MLNILENYKEKDSARANILINIAYQYRVQNQDKRIEFLNEALAIADKNNLPNQKFVALYNLGIANRLKGLKDIALLKIQQGLALAEKFSNKEQILKANSELINIYQESGFLKKALEMGLNNIEIIKNDPSSSQKGRHYYDIGNTYRRMDRYNEAEQAYLEGISICKEVNFLPGEMIMRGTLGLLYLSTEEFEKSEYHLKTALDFFEKSKQYPSMASTYLSLGNLNSLKNNHKKASEFYNLALKIFENTKNTSIQVDLNQKLFISYSILNLRDSAKIANIRYNTLKDSLKIKERELAITEMKTKYETEKIEADKNTAEAENKLVKANNRIKNFWLLGVIGLLLTIVAIGFLHAKKINLQKKAAITLVELNEAQKQLALEKQYRESELKALKAQMNPHFIFNSLNAIQEYVLSNKRNEASTYLQKFASLIRSYLDFSEVGAINIREEFETLSKYLELEKLRFEDTFNYTISIASDVSRLWQIPTMLIQPFVENALIHGLLHKKENRELDISMILSSDGNLQCIIQDNGVGRRYTEDLKNKFHASFATKATVSRLDLLNFRRDEKIGVQITDLYDNNKASGTKVILSIPIIKK